MIKKTPAFLLTFLLHGVYAIAQSKMISGKVADANGQPVVAASVQSFPSKKGTVADATGNFALNVAAADTTLKITALNFEPYQTNISGENIFSIVLAFSEMQTFKGKSVTDLSFSYIFKPLTITIGASNLFNVFPDKEVHANSYFGVFKYPPVQMGMDGAFYFARLALKIRTA